jgi:signal transduction histidine kinase
MTRRILLALLALIIAVVFGAMIPLGVDATGHDRSSFNQEITSTAIAYAAIASPTVQMRGPNNQSLNKVFNDVHQAGEGLEVLKGPHNQLASINMPAGSWSQLAAAAEQEKVRGPDGWSVLPATAAQPIMTTSGSWRIAAYPIYQTNGLGAPIGAVVLAKSVAPLNSEIRTLWLILGSVGIAAILGATLMAVWLARWVSKPLAGLDAAASKLADGNLSIRATNASGPPELRRLASTFNKMAGRLEALVHGSRAVLADVSHQLRTPLAALRLRLDLLAADAAETDPEMAAELAAAQDEVARLSRMVDGLLAVARAENVTPQPKAIDIAGVAEERVAAWLPVAEDRGIELTAAGSRVAGWLGEGHLEQILDNLIANALDALSPGDRITVTASYTPDGAQITVTDNGPGMSEEDRDRAFLRFTTGSPGGTGLGLAIVHRLITSNGGTARLMDSPGGGLTAILDFPPVPAAPRTNGSAGTEVSQPVQEQTAALRR